MIKKLIKGYIKSIVLELLDSDDVKPSFQKAKKYKIIQSKKLNFFYAMEHLDVTKIEFDIVYVDPELGATKDITKEFKDVSSLRHGLKTFNPEYNFFRSARIYVYFNHEFGNTKTVEYFGNSLNDTVFEIKELDKFIKPLIEWIESKPELII